MIDGSVMVRDVVSSKNKIYSMQKNMNLLSIMYEKYDLVKH